jgi:hypothetical protein
VTSGLENRDYDRRGSAALTMRHLYPQKLALTSPTSGGRSVGIVRSLNKVTELVNYQISLGLVVRVLGYRSGGPGSSPALPDFVRSSGSGTGSTQPREYN